MELNLGQEKDIVFKEAESVTLNKVILESISDNPAAKTVVAVVSCVIFKKLLLLWAADDYDSIGDWTQEDANKKIVELLTK